MSLRRLTFLLLLALTTVGKIYAQPATIDKNKHTDPMIMAPGYVAPINDQIEATVVTIEDYDNFKIGVDFAECSIANNPMNPTQYYAVWNSTGTAGGKGYYTNDGFTWTAGNPSWTGMWGDVVVAYDSMGNLSYQNMYGASTIQGVKVAMSSNNGQNWSSPVTAMAGSDKNWMTADQTSGPYSNYIYGTMTNSGSTGQSYSRSMDLGATWQSPTSFNPGGAIPGTSVCVGPDGSTQGGAVYVVTNSGSSFSSTYTFYRSLNGGQNFTLMSSQNYANTVGTQVGGRNAVLNMRTRPYPFIAADNSYGPHRGRLYLVYASNNPSGNGNKPDIFCRYSDNGGSTWSTAKVVNDDVNSQSNHNWFPAIWCEKNTGRLYVSWMDTRDCPTSDSCMMYATYSDDGITFAQNQKLSNKKMKINCNSCGGGGTPMYLGDYNGVAANKVSAMMAWTDFRDNSFGSYVGYFPDYGLRAEPSVDTLSPVAVINVKVPSVKLYTDTVFVSATMSGNPGLFTLSYPEGNKISSYPGEIPIQISGNGSVPVGDYTLTIVTTGSNGTPIHKRTATIRALTPIAPTAEFMVSDTSTCEGLAVNFIDYSVGPPTSWAWSFPGGNPSTSNVQNPTNIVYSTAGVYDVSLTVTNPSGSSTINKPGYISVYTVPSAPAASNVAVCEGQTVPDLTAVGENVRWYNGTLVAALGNNFTTGKTLPGTYNYTVTQNVNGCESQPTAVSLTIYALPAVTFTMNDTVCGNAAAFDLTGGQPAGGVYSGNGVAANGLTFDPTVAGPGLHTLVYSYSDANACNNTASFDITIPALPTVTINPVLAMCADASAVTLGGTPEGGVFQGNGVTGNVFDPAIAGAGNQTVTYTYADPITQCLVSASTSITVNALPSVALHDTASCGNRAVTLNATVPSGSSYLWTPGNQTTASIVADTIGRGLGVFNYSVKVTDANNCAATKSFSLTFFDCTGIDDPKASSFFEIYPNPNSGEFVINCNTIPEGKYTIRIYNAMNSLVYSEKEVSLSNGAHKQLNVRNLSSGMYLLRIENNHNGWSKQFIISK
ncbi:MAG: T9SS type A sorting domain-containing protein [Bacteroidales bacterium]|nr:T9SS type A sorting domain-containing protein [Bacteroidales bacterium]